MTRAGPRKSAWGAFREEAVKRSFLIGLVLAVQLVGAQTPGLEGRWDGLIELPDALLDVGVTLQQSEVWTGTIDIPSQNAVGVLLESVQLNGASVRFAIADVPGEPTFDGTLSGDTLSGTFSQSGETFPFTLTRQVALTGDERTAALARGRTLSEWFYGRDFGKLFKAFSDAYKTDLSRDELAALRRRVETQLGAETRVEREDVIRSGNLSVYTRTAEFSEFGLFVAVKWSLGPDGNVQSFSVRPRQDIAAPSKRLKYHTKTALQLPVGGFWYVFWGGRTVAENYHAAYPDQRFALDLLVARGGSSYRGDGSRLSDYYCFGRPLYAPGAGIVVATESDLPDLPIGESDIQNITGNYVMIDHQNGEFSLLGHLRQGSVTVAAGEKVEAGMPIGRCGNSGNTSEPHLHYQLQAGGALYGAEALPAQFLNYTADGRRVARGEPVQGQTVER